MSDSQTPNTRAIFNQAALRYEDKYMDVSLYESGLQAFCEQIKTPKARILDIACGPGNISQYLLSQRADFQLLGIDLAEEMLGLAERNNPSASFQLMDARNIRELQSGFDGIICGFGLPYLSKEEAIQLIFDAADLLSLRGTLYLSTMEDDYAKSDWQGPSDGGAERLYTYYHQADYLIEALEKAGFAQINRSVREYRQKDKSPAKDLILLAQKS
ncbi:MAG: class I SAM-dependent methyltransferase [Bacteroidia bacterium]